MTAAPSSAPTPIRAASTHSESRLATIRSHTRSYAEATGTITRATKATRPMTPAPIATSWTIASLLIGRPIVAHRADGREVRADRRRRDRAREAPPQRLGGAQRGVARLLPAPPQADRRRAGAADEGVVGAGGAEGLQRRVDR